MKAATSSGRKEAISHQVRQGGVRVKKLPGQPRTALVHVEMHHTATAGKTGEFFRRAFVVVQQHQLGGALFNAAQYLGRKGKIKDVHRAAVQGRQVVHRTDIAMVQPEVFGTVRVVKPGRQRSGKTVGAIAAVIQHQGPGVVAVGGNQKLQGKYGFHHP
jgi:hypothetical protein